MASDPTQNQERSPSPGISDEDRAYLEALQNPHKIANRIARGTHRLGYYTVVCFVVNRIIGTGIFISPGTVISGTQSVGFSLLFWLFGAISLFSVSYLYIEFGLNIPRYDKVAVPRNGGELNYLNYFIKRPAFLATCLFGITFILLGTTAGNAISFADNILFFMPVGSKRDAVVRVIAIGVVTFSCLIHGTCRRGGVLLNNIITSIKVLILCIFPVLAVCALAGVGNGNNATKNMSIKNSFAGAHASTSVYGWSNAFLSVLYAYSGFNQANYVLGEIDRPRQVFPKAVTTAVALVAVLYMMVNISYMIVVSKDAQLSEEQGVALAFFRNFTDDYRASQIFAAFNGISSLGNIIVMTFTAARVKQEIAKEGILPFAKFFGESLPKDDPNNSNFTSRMDLPVGALLLHWSIAVVIIIAAWPIDPLLYYRLLTSVDSYTVNAFFSTALGIGMLCLRFTKTSSGGRWRDKSSSNHVISIIAAVITVVTNGFPIIAAWFPPSSTTPKDITNILINPWYVVATVGWGVVVSSVIYWLVFRFVLPRVGNRKGMAFVVERQPFLHSENGYFVQYHEIVNFSWVSERKMPEAEYQLPERPLSN